MLSRLLATLAGGFRGLAVVVAILAALGSDQSAFGQVAPSGFFKDPLLVLGGDGHHAPVRSMLFASADGSQLLTGGMDKVIHVWSLDADRSEPTRTLRPPNWRGSRGQVNAIALSPRTANGNQRILAVAGAGVLGVQGEILLFRYPGPTGQGTGDVEAQLPGTAVDGTIGEGHSGVVTSLAFTPDGRFLASSSNDRTVRLWDVANRRQVGVLVDSTAELNTLAIFANGSRLVAGGADGVLRLYNIANPSQPMLLASAPPVLGNGADRNINAAFTFARTILTLAVSPDNRWIVVGTEGGALVRYEAANILANVQLLPDVPSGPIEAVAISPDGRLLATSTIGRNLAFPAELPNVSCVVDLRAMPGGQVLDRNRDPSNLVQALAFSPDSRRLAYSGGDAQAIYVKDLAPNAGAPLEIKGNGSSLWDVGIRADGNAIRFARIRAAPAGAVGQPSEFEYFDLRGRFFFNPGANELAYRHAVASQRGWTIRPFDQYRLDFVSDQGQTWRRELNPTNERRWWAYTVIPPGPGHPQPVAAVAADAGVVLWNLVTGEKTRFFNGHEGPVYAVASSEDGNWLITGSSDQTVRLWSLAGCDRPPPFGAKFDRRVDGTFVVNEVTLDGFADKIALKKGHVIEATEVGDYAKSVKIAPANLLPTLDLDSPTKMITIYASLPGEARRRDGSAPFQAATTRRDSPVLSFFPGVDRRWVLWSPRGYYDSSADGDRKFLGWLTNRGTVAQLLAGSYDSIDKFEAKYRQRKGPGNAIDRLLDTADPVQGVVANPPAGGLPDPTLSRLDVLAITPVLAVPEGAGLVPVVTPTLLINYRAVASTGSALIRALRVEINGKVVATNINPVAGPVQALQGQLTLTLGDERELRADLVAVDTLGVERVQPLDLVNRAPIVAVPRKARLEVVAIGAEDFSDKRFPRIVHAEDDAREVARFLGDRLIDPLTGVRFPTSQVHTHPFLGSGVVKVPILGAFDALKLAVDHQELGPGDVVAVVVESHFLDFHSERLLATTEPDLGLAEPPSVSANELADRLGGLSRAGCRVIVLVDAVHEIKGAAWENDIQEWVRPLQSNANVMVFIAAEHGPSSPLGDGHRVFARGVLDVLKAKSQSRLRKAGGPMSLFDFQRVVTDSVLQKTARKQHPQCYLPRTLSIEVPFLDPSPLTR